MTDAFIEAFLSEFDDSQYPDTFLEIYEMIECISNHNSIEVFFVKNRITGEYCIAKSFPREQQVFFDSESALFRKFDHENLPVFIGEYKNSKTSVLVRSYVSGVSLDKYVLQSQPTREQILSIGRQLCDILIYLHRQNPAIIHRDIKPQNIIIDKHGKITLIDFGISRVYDSSSRNDTVYLGTRNFAAPEQYGYSQTDPRSDIFSLGVLLAWLLTGESELDKALRVLPHDRLRKCILKCTAFDPKNRYQCAKQLRDALTEKGRQKRIIYISIVFVVLLFGFFIFPKSSILHALHSDEIVFQEPMIEEAVRLMLDKSATDELTKEDLLDVETLLVFGNQIATDDDALTYFTELFIQNDVSIQRGSIHLLDDLTYLQNLRHIALIYQNIADISPLSELPYLEYVDFRHNPIEDISPLSETSTLSNLILFDTNVTDLTALGQCERLENLDLGNTPIQSFAALDGLDSLRLLVIRRTPLKSLDGITNHPLLEDLQISETSVIDFSLLLKLPRLQYVYVGEDDRAAIEALGTDYDFLVIFE